MHGHYVRRRSVPHERIHPKRPPTGPQPGTRAKTSNHRSDRALGPLRHRRVGTQSNLGPPPPDVAVGPPSRPQRGPYTTPRTTSRRWRVQLCPWGVLDARWAVARAFIVALNQKSQNAKWADTNGHAACQVRRIIAFDTPPASHCRSRVTRIWNVQVSHSIFSSRERDFLCQSSPKLFDSSGRSRAI